MGGFEVGEPLEKMNASLEDWPSAAKFAGLGKSWRSAPRGWPAPDSGRRLPRHTGDDLDAGDRL
jgi:hypothetical protein